MPVKHAELLNYLDRLCNLLQLDPSPARYSMFMRKIREYLESLPEDAEFRDQALRYWERLDDASFSFFVTGAKEPVLRAVGKLVRHLKAASQEAPQKKASIQKRSGNPFNT